MVEQRPFRPLVVGSTPTAPTNSLPLFSAAKSQSNPSAISVTLLRTLSFVLTAGPLAIHFLYPRPAYRRHGSI